MQKLLLTDAHLLHVVLQQPLHLHSTCQSITAESEQRIHSPAAIQSASERLSPAACTADGAPCTSACSHHHHQTLKPHQHINNIMASRLAKIFPVLLIVIAFLLVTIELRALSLSLIIYIYIYIYTLLKKNNRKCNDLMVIMGIVLF